MSEAYSLRAYADKPTSLTSDTARSIVLIESFGANYLSLEKIVGIVSHLVPKTPLQAHDISFFEEFALKSRKSFSRQGLVLPSKDVAIIGSDDEDYKYFALMEDLDTDYLRLVAMWTL